VLVVVDVMPRVPMSPMDEVDVVLVGDRRVPAAVLVHVHVTGVREVGVGVRQRIVHVVLVDVVDVTVVQEVHVILVRHRGVAAEAVVHVGMPVERAMRGGVGHRVLRRSR
jgi:hypothetical protein